ncbi:flagellar hook-basal body complex protein FliE [Endozoicomonas sp. SCSIO W0465]|uniref:flagellar hook-basal body complex protein FliE n=1 Tax=Endozoicomonas sp. SCSIO W0465 TaxID=2918516 RepID=UPI0020762BE5|nr:flagellar hook-basal body complex protein FliE [Endozoicomonas sp. SCSIO W0465]USE37631.1 flagellar hook-basal body complex protein FliE [Endozoicomonas sp. SCSIO W0465]
MDIKGLPSDVISPVLAERTSSALPSGHASGSELPEFSHVLKTAMDKVNELQQTASAKMHEVDTGASQDLLGTMISTQKASISFQALLQVRNKAVAAYEEIMRMQI